MQIIANIEQITKPTIDIIFGAVSSLPIIKPMIDKPTPMIESHQNANILMTAKLTDMILNIIDGIKLFLLFIFCFSFLDFLTKRVCGVRYYLCLFLCAILYICRIYRDIRRSYSDTYSKGSLS